MSDIARRLHALEATVAELVAAHRQQQPDGADPGPPVAPDERFWLLTEMNRRHPDGAVMFAGHVERADGPIEWQWGVESDQLLDDEWAGCATPLAALGHPVRLRLAQQVLNGRRTTAELADDEELGTSGQLHHHLRTLVTAGWLQSTGRGRYSVPAQRVVPLLVIVSAANA